MLPYLLYGAVVVNRVSCTAELSVYAHDARLLGFNLYTDCQVLSLLAILVCHVCSLVAIRARLAIRAELRRHLMRVLSVAVVQRPRRRLDVVNLTSPNLVPEPVSTFASAARDVSSLSMPA